MKPYIKRKTASTNISPIEISYTVGCMSTPQCLVCGIIVQVGCILNVYLLYSGSNSGPQASLLEYHYITLRVQYTYTLVSHSATVS